MPWIRNCKPTLYTGCDHHRLPRTVDSHHLAILRQPYLPLPLHQSQSFPLLKAGLRTVAPLLRTFPIWSGSRYLRSTIGLILPNPWYVILRMRYALVIRKRMRHMLGTDQTELPR